MLVALKKCKVQKYEFKKSVEIADFVDYPFFRRVNRFLFHLVSHPYMVRHFNKTGSEPAGVDFRTGVGGAILTDGCIVIPSVEQGYTRQRRREKMGNHFIRYATNFKRPLVNPIFRPSFAIVRVH